MRRLQDMYRWLYQSSNTTNEKQSLIKHRSDYESNEVISGPSLARTVITEFDVKKSEDLLVEPSEFLLDDDDDQAPSFTPKVTKSYDYQHSTVTRRYIRSEFSANYDFYLMSELHGHAIAKNKLYIEKNADNDIHYKLLGNDGNILDEIIKLNELANVNAAQLDNENIASFNSIREKILTIIIKRGHADLPNSKEHYYAETTTRGSTSIIRIVRREPLSENELLLFSVNCGLMREVAWSATTFANADFFKKLPGNFLGANLSQLITVLPSMGISSLINAKISGKLGLTNAHFKDSLKQIFKVMLASWTAIPIWNFAQAFGLWLGTDILDMSPKHAGYFTGLFTGVAESIWQNVILKSLGMTVDAYDVATGILSGAAWQWAFQSHLSYDASDPNQACMPPKDEIVWATVELASIVAVTMVIGNVSARYARKLRHGAATQAALDNTEVSVEEPAASEQNYGTFLRR